MSESARILAKKLIEEKTAKLTSYVAADDVESALDMLEDLAEDLNQYAADYEDELTEAALVEDKIDELEEVDE